jgi:transcription initiation factor TFIID subunit 15
MQGEIPAKTQMPSSMITFPQHNQDIAANQTFNITTTLINLQAGDFTNAELTYYSAPTKLNAQGLVVGHTHVTVQVPFRST